MPASEHVILRSGLSAPMLAFQLLWDLEARGFTVTADPESLIVRPAAQLTPADVRAIRAYRDELLMLVRHIETV